MQPKTEINLEPQKEYTLILTGNDIVALSQAIQELPAKFANPLTAKITEQLEQATKEVEAV